MRNSGETLGKLDLIPIFLGEPCWWSVHKTDFAREDEVESEVNKSIWINWRNIDHYKNSNSCWLAKSLWL